jgi:hypothetical protein
MEEDDWRYIMFAAFIGALLISVGIIIALSFLCTIDYLLDKVMSLGRRLRAISA